MGNKRMIELDQGNGPYYGHIAKILFLRWHRRIDSVPASIIDESCSFMHEGR